MIEPYGCFLKWWYPQNTPKWSFLVGKPRVVGVVGYQNFRNPPYVFFFFSRDQSIKDCGWIAREDVEWKILICHKHLSSGEGLVGNQTVSWPLKVILFKYAPLFLPINQPVWWDMILITAQMTLNKNANLFHSFSILPRGWSKLRLYPVYIRADTTTWKDLKSQ